MKPIRAESDQYQHPQPCIFLAIGPLAFGAFSVAAGVADRIGGAAANSCDSDLPCGVAAAIAAAGAFQHCTALMGNPVADGRPAGARRPLQS